MEDGEGSLHIDISQETDTNGKSWYAVIVALTFSLAENRISATSYRLSIVYLQR